MHKQKKTGMKKAYASQTDNRTGKNRPKNKNIGQTKNC